MLNRTTDRMISSPEVWKRSGAEGLEPIAER
jgi:hypothetical protein